MEASPSIPPENVDALRAIIAAQADQLAQQARKLQSRDTLIEKLKAQLAVLKWARFGSSSEKMDRAIEQLELAREDIEAAEAEAMIPASPSISGVAKAKPSRQPLPDHLPRHDMTHQATCACPVCGGSDFIRAGESVSEVLDYVPGRSASCVISSRASPARAAIRRSRPRCRHCPSNAASRDRVWSLMC
jgi:hypothetical protein